METFEIKIKHPKSISPILFDSFKFSVEALVWEHNYITMKLINKSCIKYLPTIEISEINNDIVKLTITVKVVHKEYLNRTIDQLIKTINRMARVGCFGWE